MMTPCTTHHYACQCRELKMQKVCRALIEAHNESVLLDGYPNACNCDDCKTARELLPKEYE